MRTPVVASVALAAVIAVSAVLGVTYRSNALPMDGASLSDTSSAGPSDTSTPTGTSTPTDSGTPTASDIPSETDTPSETPPADSGDSLLFSAEEAPTGSGPTVDLDFAPAQVGVAVQLTDGADSSSTQLFIAGDDSPLGETCSGGEDAPTCTFSGLAAGNYTVVSTQSWSGGEYTPGVTELTFTVPDTPTLSVQGVEGGMSFTGAGYAGDTVRVLTDGEGGNETVCEDEVDEGGSWSCGAEGASDTAEYRAVELDHRPCLDESTFCAEHQQGGISAVAVPAGTLPTVQYTLKPAEIDVAAAPTGNATKVAVEWYSWNPNPNPDSDSEDNPFTRLTTCNGGSGEGSTFLAAGPQSCAFTDLTPGVWNAYTHQDIGDGESGSNDYVDDYFVVPESPVITGTSVAANGTVTLSGTAPAGTGIHVRADGTDVGCTPSSVTNTGVWSCTTPALTAGTHSLQAYSEDLGTGRNDAILDDDSSIVYRTGGLSALSTATSATITATATSAPRATASPTPSSTIFTWSFTVTGVDLTNVHPGDRFTVTGSGLPPGAIVSGELHSTVVQLGEATVQRDGTFSLPVVVPADFEAGAHELVMTMTLPNGSAAPAAEPITVVPVAATTPNGSADNSQTAQAPSSVAGGESRDPHREVAGGTNILTHGLNNIADVVTHPAKISAALAIGLVLLLFAGLPTHLLNSVLADKYETLRARMTPRRDTAPPWWRRLRSAARRAPVLLGLGMTTVTALLFGFADPHFGFTLASLRLVLGLAIALAVTSYLVNVIVNRLLRGRWKVDVEVSIRPLGLVLAVVGVVVSRALEFSPGFLVGLVIGLVIAEKSAKAHAWRAVLLRTSILLGFALVAWFSFSLFDSDGEGGSFATELAIETLVAITTEAVAGLLVELLPLRLLQGEKLFEKTKVGWGALYLLTVVIFVIALVPWEGNWAALGNSLWTWLGIVVGFGVLATAVYILVRIREGNNGEVHHDDDLVPVGAEVEER